MGNLQGGELLLLILLALIVLGPERLPGYAAKLAQAVRNLRDLAEGAKSQIKDEMGPAFDDINWRQLDPRQYDPRRIVRDALSGPSVPAGEADSPGGEAHTGGTMVAAGGAGAGLTGAGTTGGGATGAGLADPAGFGQPGGRGGRRVPLTAYDPDLPTPYDTDAT